MANTTTTTTTTTKPAVGPYRARPAWQAAMGTASGTATGNPALRGLLSVATHLAWRGPGGHVGWHKGTTPSVVAVANTNGATTGTPVPVALAAVLAAAGKAASNPAQRKAVAALAAAAK